MIISVWKPVRKSIDKKSIITQYDLIDDNSNIEKFPMAYKVVWKCDCKTCKYPNKFHGIDKGHLNEKRSKTVNLKTQICRSCQVSGDKNPKFGDKRTFEEQHGIKKANLLKEQMSKRFSGDNNPSKRDDVKIKKGQIIINFDNVSKLLTKENYILINIEGFNDETTIIYKCPNNHQTNTIYKYWRNGSRCKYCYYESIKIPYEQSESFEKYNKNVRNLSSSSFRFNRSFIDPSGLKEINSRKYHVDHIYSVIDGFLNNIDPKIISSPINLRVISQQENLLKGSKSDILLEDLLKKYNDFKINF